MAESPTTTQWLIDCVDRSLIRLTSHDVQELIYSETISPSDNAELVDRVISDLSVPLCH